MTTCKSLMGKFDPSISSKKLSIMMITIIRRHNLKILGLLSSDSGMFQCVGINNAGSVQASAFLEVIPLGEVSLSSFVFISTLS